MSQINTLSGHTSAMNMEGTQPQAVTQAKTNDRIPEALLARLSGTGMPNSPFTPKLVGQDSYLARMADQFARRPLGSSPAGKLASNMMALADSLANKAITREDLAQLDALRSQADKADMPADAQTFCNTLARTTMLRPLTDALARLEDNAIRTALAEALHGQVEKLFSAQNKVQLQLVSHELAGMRETFLDLGILKSEHDVIFMHLNSVLSFRANLAVMMDEVAADMAKLEQGQAPAIALDDLVAKAERLYERASGDEPTPAFARMNIGAMAANIKSMAMSLRSEAAVRALGLSENMAGIATQARQHGADLAALTGLANAAKDELNSKAFSLLAEHQTILQDMHASLGKTIETSQLLQGAETLRFRADVSVADLKEKAQELTAAKAKPGLAPEDCERLDIGVLLLNDKVSQIRHQALESENGFAEAVGKKLDAVNSEANYESILADIAARKAALPHTELSENDMESSGIRLTELEHKARVGKFMAHFSEELFDSLGQKQGTPSIAELHTKLEGEKGKGTDVGVAPSLLIDISKEQLSTLTDLVAQQSKAIEDSAKPSELRTSFDDMAKQAEHFLLPADKDKFTPELAKLQQQKADAIYNKEAKAQFTSNALKDLGQSYEGTLKALCLGAKLHPSLFTLLNELDTKGLKGLLDACTRIMDAKAGGIPPQNDDLRNVDALFLRYPELDDVASALLRKDGADYHFDSARMLRDLKAHMEQHFPAALRARIDLGGKGMSDITFLAELVANAAKARLADKARLQQIDFNLIQALWFCNKASDDTLDFSDFKNTLPEPYRGMPLLQNYMDAGISGRRALSKLSHSASLASQGMGTSWALKSFLTEAQAQNIKWAAGMGVRGLYKELGLQEHQDLKGAFAHELKDEKAAGGKNSLAGRGADFVDGLLFDQEGYSQESLDLSNDKTYCKMATRLGQDPKSVKDISKGSSLAAFVLLMDKVLRDSTLTVESQQAFIEGMYLQPHIHLDTGMVGARAFLSTDKMGAKFKNAVGALKKSPNAEAFKKAKDAMLAMLDGTDDPTEPGKTSLTEKAEAVFYFKAFEEQASAKAVESKLYGVVEQSYKFLWGDSYRKFFDETAQSILVDLKKHGIVAGTGHEQKVKIQEANENADFTGKMATKALKWTSSSFNQGTRERLGKIVSLALCEQVATSSEFNSLDDLKNAFEDHKSKPKNWDFFKKTLARLDEMGLPEGTAALFLRQTLDSMEDDFFVQLAKSGMSDVKPKDALADLVDAQMAELREDGRSFTMSTTNTNRLAFTAGPSGVVEVGPNLELARQNGLNVWKDAGGSYHMTFMDGAKLKLGATIGVELQKVFKAVSFEASAKAEAHVQGNAAHGCDLSFSNAAHCQMFLYAMVSGQPCTELFALCKEASLVTEGGLGAGISLSAEAHVNVDDSEEALLATELGAEAKAGIEWRHSYNGEHHERRRTVSGSVALTAEASLNLGVLEENVTSFAKDLKDSLTKKVDEKIDGAMPQSVPSSVGDAVKEKLGEKVDEKSGEALDAFSKAMAKAKGEGEDGVIKAEKSRAFAYEETRIIRERNTLTSGVRPLLEAYERVRAFAPENKAEAIDLMRKHKVSPACISAVLEELKDMPASEGFRLELVTSMKPTAIDAYNSNPKAKIDKGALELTKVRVMTDETYEKERSFERGPVNVNIHRGFTRTLTRSFDALTGVYEGGKQV